MIRLYIVIALTAFCFYKGLSQSDTIFVYGPGGPYPVIQKIADNFEKLYNKKIVVTKGPLKNWKADAIEKADLIYRGSEDMMSDFMTEFSSVMDNSTIYPLHYRASGLIVRKGNPKNIKKIQDLQRKGINIMVVKGAGLKGVWEDMLGSLKNMDAFRDIRSNIIVFAENSGSAEKAWKENTEIDVWISWNIWQKANSANSDFVRLKEKYTIYRDCGISLTQKGNKSNTAKQFYNYLKTKEASSVFKQMGWQ